MTIPSNTAELIEFTRLYLALFYTFVAIFYTSKILWMRRSQGPSLVFAGNRFTGTWWNHIVFRLFRVTIWLVCVFRYFKPEVDHYLITIPTLEQYSLLLAGNILLSVGFIWVLMVHFYLGNNWRSGIDPDGPTLLVTTGIYRFTRNPMFIGIIVAQLGFFLALPSVFTAVCLLIGVIALRRQTQAEEQHLSEKFGAGYADYVAKVPRWIKLT